jgi:endonuclease YncB( thermonuclease family)
MLLDRLRWRSFLRWIVDQTSVSNRRFRVIFIDNIANWCKIAGNYFRTSYFMKRAAILLSFALLCGINTYPQEVIATLSGKVVDVADGDTITIVDKHKVMHLIRMVGIDAPEKMQDFGDKARQYLSDLVFGKTVRVEGTSYDRYGRLRGKVLLNGRDMNLELVIAGFAWHYTETAAEQSDRDRQVYESAELIARRSKFNIWSAGKPVPPWQYKIAPAADAKQETTAPATQETSAPVTSATNSEATPQISLVKPELSLRTLSLPAGKIIGNRNSHIYHWPGCPGYTKIAEKNQVPFSSPAEAEAAGYRAAKNCTQF